MFKIKSRNSLLESPKLFALKQKFICLKHHTIVSWMVFQGKSSRLYLCFSISVCMRMHVCVCVRVCMCVCVRVLQSFA